MRLLVADSLGLASRRETTPRERRIGLRRAPDAAADAVLMRLAAAGQAMALARLYRRHSPRLLEVAFHALRDPADAEEVVQEAFLYAWRHAGRFDPARSSVATWLGLITRSRSIDRLRQRRRAAAASLRFSVAEAVGPPELEEVLRDEGARRLRQLVRRLPDSQRQAVELCYYRGLSHAAAAHATGIPVGTIKTRTAAALRNLRRALLGAAAAA